MLETVIRRRGYAEHAKVSDESKRYGISSTAWWSTCGRYGHVLDLNKRHAFLATTVKAAKVLVLSEELNGRLRAICVQLGHVQIVYEDNHLFILGRSKHVLSLFLKLGLNHFLCSI